MTFQCAIFVALDNPLQMESQGNINYCDHPSPVSISPSLVASCKAGGGFHSVLGDREKVNGTFREFIVPCQSRQNKVRVRLKVMR